MKITEALNILSIVGKAITKDQIKEAYKNMAKKYHPDINENGIEIMKMVNNAYEFLMNNEFDFDINSGNNSSYIDEVEEALNIIRKCENLIIEVCGNWIWVSGPTKEYKEILKEANFRYAPNKKMWYFRPESYSRSRYHKSWNMNKIRDTYGSETVDTEKGKRIAS